MYMEMCDYNAEIVFMHMEMCDYNAEIVFMHLHICSLDAQALSNDDTIPQAMCLGKWTLFLP